MLESFGDSLTPGDILSDRTITYRVISSDRNGDVTISAIDHDFTIKMTREKLNRLMMPVLRAKHL